MKGRDLACWVMQDPLLFSHQQRSYWLELITKAELVLTFRCIRRAFTGYLSERLICWVHIRIVPVGVVDEVEGLSLENQLMAFKGRDNVKALLERGVVALESRAVDNVA